MDSTTTTTTPRPPPPLAQRRTGPRAVHAATVATGNPHGIVWHIVWADFSASWQVVAFQATGNRLISEHDNAEDALRGLNELVRAFWQNVASGGPAVNRATAMEHMTRIHPSPRDNSVPEAGA